MNQDALIKRVARSVGYWAAHTLNENRRSDYYAGLYSKGQRDGSTAILRDMLEGKPAKVRRAAGAQIKESFRWCWTDVLKKAPKAA